jgi:hypothetical protein
MAVEVKSGATPQVGMARVLFSTRTPPVPGVYRRNYDVGPNGQRFLFNSISEESTPPAITVVLNWHIALRSTQ